MQLGNFVGGNGNLIPKFEGIEMNMNSVGNGNWNWELPHGNGNFCGPL